MSDAQAYDDQIQREHPTVDVIIACHSTARPLARAVASVLDGNANAASVTVVAHNIAVDELRAVLPHAHASQVRWLSLNDGTHSPANPYNYGTAGSTSEWVSLLGSDDYLQPGAVADWLSVAADSDAVITRLMHDTGVVVKTPPVRPFHQGLRDAVSDRLYYRSAPLGLMRREFLEAHDLRWDADLTSGGDLRLSTMLWSSGRVFTQTMGPGYVIGADAGDRVTMRLAPLDDELSHVDRAWGEHGWARRLTLGQRDALATKYLRIHIFGAAYYRAAANCWTAEDRLTLSRATALILRRAPRADRALSIADRSLLVAALDTTTPDHVISRLALARRRFYTLAALIPRDLSQIFNREAPLRFMASSALVR